MKTKVFFAIFLLISAFAFGQKETSDPKGNIEEVKVTPPEFTGVDHQATQAESASNSLIVKYLTENVVYPENAKRLVMQGTEVVQFTVATDGKLNDFKVINSVCPEIDDEIIRVLQKTSGKWKPGLNNGEAVEMEKEVSMLFCVLFDEFKKPADLFKEKATKFFNEGNQNLLVKNNPKKALKSFDKALVYLPYESALLFSRGLAKYSLNDKAGAQQDWDRMNNLAENGKIQFNLELIAEDYKNMDGYKEYQNMAQK